MKKVLSFILALSMVLSLIASIPVSASGKPEVGISVSSQTANVGDIVTATLYIKGAPTLAELGYVFGWDRTKFQLWHKTSNVAATSFTTGVNDSDLVGGQWIYFNESLETYEPIFSRLSPLYTNSGQYGLIGAIYSCEQIIGGSFVPFTIPVDLNTPFVINKMRFKCIATGSPDFRFAKESESGHPYYKPYDEDFPYGVELQMVFGEIADITTNVQQINPPQPPVPPGPFMGIPPSHYGGCDGKIPGITTDMEYKLASAQVYTACSGSEITGLASGKYNVRIAATAELLASDSVDVIVPIPKPQGITSEPGKITGTTADMEYKKSTSASWIHCLSGTISGLTAGTYQVRYIGTADLPPSESVDVVVNEAVPGDTNNDGRVNAIDLGAVKGTYGKTSQSVGWDANCDFNQDNRVNGIELGIVKYYYGINPTNYPEWPI